MRYKHNEPRRHKIPKARYRVENWREYEVALRDRGSLTVWVTPEAIAAWHPARTGRPGRSAHYSDLAIETGVMLRLAFARPWRQTEGLLRSVTTLLGLRLDVPDHTTLSRRTRPWCTEARAARFLKGCGHKRLPIFMSGAAHAFQVSFERPAPHCPSASSGDELAGI